MTYIKTPEELYDEAIQTLGDDIIAEYLEAGPEWLTIVESLEDENISDEDVQKDVYSYVEHAGEPRM